MIREFIKKIIPVPIRKILWILNGTIRYPFKTPLERAYFRWKLTKSENKRYCYDLNEDSVVFDGGGYKGDFADEIVKRYNPKVYIFEPVHEFADLISIRFKDNEKVKVYKFGLSDYSSQNKMYISEDGSSVYCNNSKQMETVSMVNIVEFIEENAIDKIDLLKLNIEGGEYAVLDKLFESGYIRIVKYLQIQFHNVSDNSISRMKEQISALKETHELMWKCRPFIWESWKLKGK